MITIFIGTFNRLDTLERTVRSYKRFAAPHEVVIVDNGTDHPKCLALLERLEKKVKKIYSLPGCDSMEEVTDNFNVAIRDQYDHSGGSWFAVSEADVCFEGTDAGALTAYLRVAKKTGCAVGPHLRVDRGIPVSYPLRSRVLACETWMQYRSSMDWLDEIPYNSCQTDTTFHLFPRTRFFNRLRMNTIRVGPPYDAKHLDWYVDVFEPTPENSIYIQGMRPVGSWGKAWIRDYWRWFQQYGPDVAFESLLRQPLSETDLCNNSFMLSWSYQYGVGCERDHDKSVEWLKGAIPYPYDHYWPYAKNWLEMVYDNNFTSLGWS